VIIISQRMNVGRTMGELAIIWEASEAGEWMNLIVELPFNHPCHVSSSKVA
jgi:hypothetical protein